MSRTRSVGLAVVAVLVLGFAPAVVGSASPQTTILDFEDLAPTGGFFQPMPSGYGAINWSDVFWPYDQPQDPFNAKSGIVRIASNRVPRPDDPIPRGQFQFVVPDQVFNGAWFAGPSPPQLVEVQFLLFNDGALVHSSAVLQMSPVPTFLASGYSGLVDAVTILGPEGEFVFDDLSYSSPSSTQVSIDVKPGDGANIIKLGNAGLLPVAVLTTSEFDASAVDPVSICFGDGDAAVERDCTEAHGRGHLQDVDADGDVDLLLHFEITETGIDPGDTSACLGGATVTGQPIDGCDVIQVKAAKCVPPPAGLVGWWPGNGDATDIAGGRDGILHGDTTFDTGMVGQAFELDGDGDFVDVADDPTLDVGTGDFTVDLWARFNDTSGEQILVEKWIQRFDGPSIGWTFTKLDDNSVLLTGEDGLGGGNFAVSAPLNLPTDTWIHFAARRSGDRVEILMNGVVVASNTTGGVGNLDSASSVKFGHRGNPEDTPGSQDERGFFLNGLIDEVELFDRALTNRQVRAIFEAGSSGKCAR